MLYALSLQMPSGIIVTMDLNEEKILIEQAKINPLAFGKLYDEYYPRISNYLLHRMSRAEIALDLTSEVFYKAMTKIHQFTWRNITFSAWLYKIANNEIKMYYRKKESKNLSLENLFELNHFEPPDSVDIEKEYIEVEEQLLRNKKFKEVQKYLLELSSDYQEILVLRFFEDKSLEEICEITEKNLNTVKSLIFRGKEKLRIQMSQKNGGEQ